MGCQVGSRAHHGRLDSPMPWDYRYEKQAETFISTSWGTLTDEDLTSGFSRLVVDPNFRDDRRWFGDHTLVDKFAVTQGFLAHFPYAEKVRLHRGRRSFLMFTPNGSSLFEHYLCSLNSSDFRLFYERRKAVDWINEGVPPEMRLTAEVTTIGHGAALLAGMHTRRPH